MAIEEASYSVEKSHGPFELRAYGPQVVAETLVDGPLEAAGNRAFKALFGDISGENRARAKVDMTAPASQQAAGERIPMTAPVGQQPVENEGKWIVSFMMPAGTSIQTLPEPQNPAVTLREVPNRRMAVIRSFSLRDCRMADSMFTTIHLLVWHRRFPSQALSSG